MCKFRDRFRVGLEVLPEGGWLVCFYYNWWDGLGWAGPGREWGLNWVRWCCEGPPLAGWLGIILYDVM